MSTDFSALCGRAARSSATVLDNLAQIEAALSDVQGELGNLPFFARTFVSAEVKRGTGQDMAAWLQAVSALIATLREAEAAVGRVRATATVSDADRGIIAQAGERAEAERARLGTLVGYMEQAPSKIQTVPTGMLPAERRDELLGAIARQTQALRDALAAMPELVERLTAVAGAAA